jgi:hypothetical protein
MNDTAWFLLVLAGLAIALAALYRANARDRAALARTLGLAPVARGRASESVHPVMGPCFETPLMRGTLDGVPAEVLARTIRRLGRRNPNARSAFTVLRLRVPTSAPRLRIEPRGTGTMLASLGEGEPEIATGDAGFDADWRVSGPRPAEALALLSPELRATLTALRASLAPGLPDSALGRFSGDLMVGTFEIGDGRLDYAAMGTPTPGLAAHLAAAVPCALALARRTGAG